MCLDLDMKATKRAKKRKKKYVLRYKVLSADGRSPIFNTQFKVGKNVSSRQSKKLLREEIKRNEVNEGIHVYTNEDGALNNTDPWEKIVIVKCYTKDLVAVGVLNYIGYREEVYTKVYIDSFE